ncbi:MAG TPA: GSCFA domain-containing protein [Prolixibacteraceae bacterium]|nr:GSCFA domain-containing protein [Prolixibacteraceae bacterium]
MDFPLRTEVSIEPAQWDFNYQTPAMFLGSCFSDHMGGALLRSKFPVQLNPFGVLYNPISLSMALNRILDQQEVSNDELVFHDGLWHSFYFHGSFSNSSKETLIEQCNRAIAEASTFLKSAQFLFITLGTAWVFRHQESGKIVSNCHKIPASNFERFRLSIDEIREQWLPLLSRIHQFNPKLKIIFTVSPIRHFKDGAHENQLSKSTLLLAIDEITQAYPVEQIGYFPSYELMNDELRDYRFYKEDMVHIAETGIRFIFEKFKFAFFSKETTECFNQIQPIILAKEHKILNKNDQSVTIFAEKTIEKITYLQKKYPNVNFEEEMKHFIDLAGLEKGFY